MNKYVIIFSSALFIIVLSILIYIAVKNSKIKDTFKAYKNMEYFIFNKLQKDFSRDFSHNVYPENLYKLIPNFLNQARCYNSIIFQICQENSLEYIYNDINVENYEKILPYTENKKYKNLWQNCYYDKQLYCIKYLYNTKSDINNIINYVIENIYFEPCNIQNGTCELSESELDILDDYDVSLPPNENIEIFRQPLVESGVPHYSYSTLGDDTSIPSIFINLPIFQPPIDILETGKQIIYYLGNIEESGNLISIEMDCLLYLNDDYSFYSFIIRNNDGTYNEIRKNFQKSYEEGTLKFDLTENKINDKFNVPEILNIDNLYVDKTCAVFLYLYGSYEDVNNKENTGGIRINNSVVKLLIE